MQQKHWIIVALAVAVTALGFFILTPRNKEVITAPSVAHVAKQLAEQMPEHEIALSYTETVDPETYSSEAAATTGEEKKDYGRLMSWFGLGAVEGGVQSKGIVSNGVSLGRSEGYGILERLWVWLKDMIWALSFGTILLIVLCFVPVVGPIAQGIVRFIASLIPGLASITERMFASVQLKKPLVQVVAGGQKFKAALAEEPSLTDFQKARVVELFHAAQNAAQTSDLTRKTVEKLQ